jgi:exopolyphosphatase/pppGpp-phosphohydrolase
LLESACEVVSAIDIGGASTEVAVGRSAETPRSISIEIGSLTSLAGLSSGFDADGRLSAAQLSDLLSCCRRALSPDAEDLLRVARAFVAVGGERDGERCSACLRV